MQKIFIKILLYCFCVALIISITSYYFLSYKSHSFSLPQKENSIPNSEIEKGTFFFIGTTNGLYKIEQTVTQLLKEEIIKILPTKLGLWVLTPNQLLFSKDHNNFVNKTEGIKKKVIKTIDENNNLEIIKENEFLKDIAVDPLNPNILITAGINGVYYTVDNGDHWQYVPSESATNGIKSVGIYSWNNKIHLLFGHPYQGLYYKTTDQKKWSIISKGLATSGTFRDEISSILVTPKKEAPPQILVGQNFHPAIFEFKPDKKIFQLVYKHKNVDDVELVESLQQDNGNIIFINNQGILSLDAKTKEVKNLKKIQNFMLEFKEKYPSTITSISAFYQYKNIYSISELWLLQDIPLSPFAQKSIGKKGVYVQTHVLNSPKRLSSLLELLKATHQNMIVVDMKDDFGAIRFNTTHPILTPINAVKNPINLSKIVPLLKEAGIYLVARIPVFKDAVLFNYNNGEYAVKDTKSNKPWIGLKKTKSGNLVPTKEYWVDPYNEKVWEYNIALSQELIKYGFDEIQFDYIRFPTDGVNLKSTFYPSQLEGMDKESALISFLKYARNRLKGVISIDIYGANGWMRTGARTGQDVELLSRYSDVIAPMYYPSHFGNSFLNFAPYEQRPYRIYKQGSFRNYYIARKKSVIRPYLQVFSLPRNAYDQEYYGPQYINLQIKGVDESINLGYTFWNSSSKYSILYNTILTNS